MDKKLLLGEIWKQVPVRIDILQNGSPLPEDEARAWFPEIKLKYIS
ncbi:MAG: hypothetical protein HY063_03250 [Bacteroidetes bacterium]|nr:hypothetical protein [Bacteroidota bacterium]